jgi:hypothetical protein
VTGQQHGASPGRKRHKKLLLPNKKYMLRASSCLWQTLGNTFVPACLPLCTGYIPQFSKPKQALGKPYTHKPHSRKTAPTAEKRYFYSFPTIGLDAGKEMR